MKEKHASENKKFNTMFPAHLREEWLSMIRNWEFDNSKPNPYTHTEKGILIFPLRCYIYAHVYLASNLAEVRRKLAEADEEDVRQGTTPHQVPGSVFIRTGLEIEEQQ